jgi:hypothetical protein
MDVVNFTPRLPDTASIQWTGVLGAAQASPNALDTKKYLLRT